MSGLRYYSDITGDMMMTVTEHDRLMRAAKSKVPDRESLTKEQAIILTGFTGILMSEYMDFHDDLCKRWGDPYLTSGALAMFPDKIKETYRADFERLIDYKKD